MVGMSSTDVSRWREGIACVHTETIVPAMTEGMPARMICTLILLAELVCDKLAGTGRAGDPCKLSRRSNHDFTSKFLLPAVSSFAAVTMYVKHIAH